MTAGRSRRRSAAYAALALALCGSLALTGCNSHSKSKKSKKHSYSSSSKSKKHKLAGAAGVGAGAGAGAASHRLKKCTTGTSGDFKFAPKSKSVPHLVLAYHNTKSYSCTLYNAPMVFLGKSAQPLGYYEGAPTLVHSHQIEVPAGGRAYAAIPTPDKATKGTPQRAVTIAFMMATEAKRQGLSTSIEYDRYEIPPTIGKTAKVSDWYLSYREAERQSDTL